MRKGIMKQVGGFLRTAKKGLLSYGKPPRKGRSRPSRRRSRR